MARCLNCGTTISNDRFWCGGRRCYKEPRPSMRGPFASAILVYILVYLIVIVAGHIVWHYQDIAAALRF